MRAELDNPDGMLRPGLFVSVTLPYGEARNAVLVNDASIGTDQLGKYLYVVNDSDIVNYRHIEVGQLADHNMRVVKKWLVTFRTLCHQGIVESASRHEN